MRTKNILLMNVNWLGDVLFSTPTIRALKRNFPQARISVLIHPRCREILEGNPSIDELITYDEEGIHRSFIGKLRLIFYLRKKRFERVYILHRSLTRAIIAYLSGIPKRIGYRYRKRALFLTDNFKLPLSNLHRADFYLGILNSSGIEVKGDDKKLEFFITDKERQGIKEILKTEGIRYDEDFIVINPGANWLPKRWPKENFAELADILIEKYSKRVVITGSKKDSALADEIARLMKNRPVILAGKTTLKELGGLLERASLVISADSGPLHIAIAMGIKAIGLYGPTSLNITGPYRNNHILTIQKMIGCKIPCYNVDCTDNRCMKTITTGDVLKEVEKLIK